MGEDYSAPADYSAPRDTGEIETAGTPIVRAG